MKLPFTYEDCLDEMLQAEARSYLLSDFWRRPNSWPKGNRDTIFIGDAIQRIGQLKFGDAWTGQELSAERRAPSRPSFAGTLEYYWGRVRSTFPAGTFNATWLASWDGPVPPPFAASLPTSPRELKAQQSARTQRLEQEGAEFRPAYDRHVANWQKRKDDNDGAKERLLWVLDWIATAGRLGDLETRLRRVDSENGLGHYVEAPDGFWNVENPIQSRFHKGQLRLSMGGEIYNRFYIHFSSLSLSSNEFGFEFRENPLNEGIHLSIYMKLILESLRDLNITSENQPDASIFKHYFESKWPPSLKKTDAIIAKMTTIAREPESGRGAYKPTRKNRRQKNIAL